MPNSSDSLISIEFNEGLDTILEENIKNHKLLAAIFIGSVDEGKNSFTVPNSNNSRISIEFCEGNKAMIEEKTENHKPTASILLLSSFLQDGELYKASNAIILIEQVHAEFIQFVTKQKGKTRRYKLIKGLYSLGGTANDDIILENSESSAFQIFWEEAWIIQSISGKLWKFLNNKIDLKPIKVQISIPCELKIQKTQVNIYEND